MRKTWTEADRQLLKALYREHTAAQLATIFHCSIKAVQQQAEALGLSKQPRLKPPIIRQVKKLYNQGMTDAAIGRVVGVCHRSVGYIRAKYLGLPVNAKAVLASRRRAVKTQYERLGIKTAGELRQWSYRQFAVANGWPEKTSPRGVQILNVLAEGPLTAQEIAAKIGMPATPTHPTGKRRIYLSGNWGGGTYTSELMRAGLVMHIPRYVAGRPKSIGPKLPGLYQLTPLAIAMIERRQ